MSNLFEKFHDVVDELYLITHAGFSQFEVDADELNSAITQDLYEDPQEHSMQPSVKKTSHNQK